MKEWNLPRINNRRIRVHLLNHSFERFDDDDEKLYFRDENFAWDTQLL